MQTLKEGTTTFVTDSTEKISKGMPVFYNPAMKLNRDLSLLIVRTLEKPRVGLPMEASGIRAARMLNELRPWRPHSILVNDISPKAIETARKNIEPFADGVPVEYSALHANRFLKERQPFDYVDIDPFGTPNPFLDAAVRALRRDGILAVTATDTSALAGTYPKATARKYWSVPSRTWAMHEIGLRILVRKVQLVAAQYDIALTPVLSVAADHYYRIFLRQSQGAGKADALLKQHGTLRVDTETMEIAPDGPIGPLWTGPLHDPVLVQVALKAAGGFDEARNLLMLTLDEARIGSIGFVDINELASRLGVESPKRDALLERLGGHGARTHISPTGFKTDLPMEKVRKLFTGGRTGRGARPSSRP